MTHGGPTICPNCQQPIPGNAPRGLCPRCVFAAAMPAPGGPELKTTQFDPHRLPLNGLFAPPTPAELTERFEDLQVEALIGHGGMGAVYRARQKKLDRIVALKVLAPSLGSNPMFVERFAREAKALAKLTHPNIVMVFEFGTLDELCYLVMEMVDGINLRDAIRSKSIAPVEALQIVPQICEALQYAHDEGVVHRDIKPENILLNRRGQVKIADFGLAKLLDSESDDLTLTGTHQVMGTRNYMAPEQIESPQSVDHRADIYSLGVVFYELLTGELPLGRFANPSDKAAVSTQLDEIVLKTLEKEPARRFQQASQIRTAVHDMERQQHAPAPHHSPTFPSATLPATLAASASSGTHHITGRGNEPAERQPLATVPFTIGELHGGFSEAKGLLTLHESGLALEYEIKDGIFGATVKELTTVKIPLERIRWADFQRGMFSRKITVVTNSVLASREVPGAEQGQFSLKISSAAAKLADELVLNLKGLIERYKSNPAHFHLDSDQRTPTSPVSPVKSPSSEHPRDALAAESAIKRLEQPLGYLKIVAILNLIINAGSLISASKRIFNYNPLRNLNLTDSAVIWDSQLSLADNLSSIVGGLVKLSVYPFQFSSNIVSFVVAIFILIGISHAKQLKNYPLTVGLLCLALLPIYDLYVFGLCFGIWSLVILLDSQIKFQFQNPDSSAGPLLNNRASYAAAKNQTMNSHYSVLPYLLPLIGLIISLIVVGLMLIPTQTTVIDLKKQPGKIVESRDVEEWNKDKRVSSVAPSDSKTEAESKKVDEEK